LQSTRGTAAEFSIATSSSAIDQTAPRPAVVLVIITKPLGHRQ
jgi:hypothetical protein